MTLLLVKIARWHMRMYCIIMSYVVGGKITEADIYKAIIKSGQKSQHSIRDIMKEEEFKRQLEEKYICSQTGRPCSACEIKGCSFQIERSAREEMK